MSVRVEPSLTNERYCPTCEGVFAAGDECPNDGARLVKIIAPSDPLVRRELDGRFTIVQKIGSGGMGAVYRGIQHSVDREVAIKVVSAPLLSSANMIKRFFREAKLASRLNHPNAVGVYDFGQTQDGVFYLVMELIRGRTIHQLIKAGETFSPARIIRIGMQVCDALVAAHALSIIHRDLKPANIMLVDETRSTKRDFVKVLDFGLAKSISVDDTTPTVSGDSTVLGTPAYISPEAVRGARLDGRSDLYSLGCILYLLGASRLPFEAESSQDMVRMHGHKPAPPMTDVPEALAKVIDRLLAHHPNNRYPSAAAAHDALEAALNGVSLPALPSADERDPTVNETPKGRRTERADDPEHPQRRRRRWLAVAAAGALTLAIASTVMIAGSRSSDEASAAPPSPPPAAPPTVEAPTPTAPVAESTPTPTVPVEESPPTTAAQSPPRRPKPATKPKRPPVRKPSRDPKLPF